MYNNVNMICMVMYLVVLVVVHHEGIIAKYLLASIVRNGKHNTNMIIVHMKT